jgi:coenzyme F420-reducing hydrogenase gamma subunit
MTAPTHTAHPPAAPQARDNPDPRPRLAVWKFASCDGCQLTLLNCEDELLAVTEQVQVAYFPEATRAVVSGPYDVSLVEGSITTPADAERIQQVRASSRVLITIGACATSGGIQALRNNASVREFMSVVYAHPEYIATLGRSTPISAHVTVDFQLRGCPIDRGQLLEVIAATLQGRRPRIPTYSVCVECKRRGTVCVAVADGMACLGPVTQAGCGALCPTYHRGCYGCFGPQDTPNAEGLAGRLLASGVAREDAVRMFRTFNTGAEAFRSAAEALSEQTAGTVPPGRHGDHPGGAR